MIDADALIDTLVNACNNDQFKFFPVWIEKQIDAQPTVAMLKEQEPVPLIHSAGYEEYWDVENICPKCNAHWISLAEDHFCPQCGQAVKDDA